MSDREYSTTDAAHGLSGFSSNSGALGDPNGLWSHQPVQKGPKESGDGKSFLDPIEAGPKRQELWNDGNQPSADDDSQGWPTPASGDKGGVTATGGGKADGVYSQGRHDGTERGNSPWFRGGPH